MVEPFSDAELAAFLVDLDESDFDLTGWEVDFVADNLKRYEKWGDDILFTGPQREAIESMIEKYGNDLGWA